MLESFSVCPIRPRKAGKHLHLILMVNDHSIVDSSVSQPISPDTLPTVQVCPCVTGNVPATNPQIDVELVGMRRSRMEVCAADDRFAVRAVKDVNPAVRESSKLNFISPRSLNFANAPLCVEKCL